MEVSLHKYLLALPLDLSVLRHEVFEGVTNADDKYSNHSLNKSYKVSVPSQLFFVLEMTRFVF